MKRNKRHAGKSRRPSRTIYIIAAVVLLIAAVGIYYLVGLKAHYPGSEFMIYHTVYHATVESCSGLPFSSNSNITEICTAILNVSSYSNPEVPYYLIINKYAFLSEADASSFLQALRSDLNTSPWYSNIPNAYYNSSVVYTTVVYPDYKNTNTSAEVLAAYTQDNNIVLSASTSNMTNNANSTVMKEYAEYLIFNYQKQIEGMK